MLFGQLMSVIANAQRSKSQRPYRPEQFIPKWDPEAPAARKPEMDGEQMLRAVKGLQRRYSGGKERTGGDAR